MRDAITELDGQIGYTLERVEGLEESVAMLDIEAALADAAGEAQEMFVPPDLATLKPNF